MPTKDVIQDKKKLDKPEFRIWICKAKGDDYYYSFNILGEALLEFYQIIMKGKEIPHGLFIAWDGKEYGMDEKLPKKLLAEVQKCLRFK